MRETEREDTLASHRQAVERVIMTARERLCEPISLRDMSRVAYLSEFHFNRVFHQITGLPPNKFISAMRLDEAESGIRTAEEVDRLGEAGVDAILVGETLMRSAGGTAA